ncbi:MAG: PadR family transcriptional regulator [Clostridiaceae bacterium]|jgi:PadR family transcriptional regulator PadR|nr:PadR family transcriptional regulator [Clostridiaceae bacterium]
MLHYKRGGILNDNITRQLKKGVLEIVILKLLSNKDMYGYELVSEINQRSKSLNIKEGTLYPILYRLEDNGLIEAHWEQAVFRKQPKKFYSVTEKGKQAMSKAYSQWKAITQDITRIMEGLT